MSDITGTTATSHQPTATLPAGDTASAISGTSSATNLLGSNGVNADTFLKLLVAQLQYQNPDNPVDSTQFLSQTASFEEVQELGSLQTSLSSLVTSQQAGAATSMLGQQVTGTDQSGNSVSVNDEAKIGLVRSNWFDAAGNAVDPVDAGQQRRLGIRRGRKPVIGT